MSALIVIVFTALNYNAAGSLDGVNMRRAHNMRECLKWRTEYDTGMLQVNSDLPPAFKIRWATECKIMVPSLGVRSGV